MSGSVTVRDHGYDALLRRVRESAKGKVVDVGVMGSEASQPYDGGVTVADVATWQEFGTRKIPARSFIRAYVDENHPELKRAIGEIAKRVVKGELKSIDQGLELLGLKVQKEIIARIRAGIAPPLSARTIDRKGSTVPLIDTSQLVNSITYALRQLAGAA